jgi:hypothetical protein
VLLETFGGGHSALARDASSWRASYHSTLRGAAPVGHVEARIEHGVEDHGVAVVLQRRRRGDARRPHSDARAMASSSDRASTGVESHFRAAGATPGSVPGGVKKGGSRCGSAVWWARNRLATTLETPRCARSAPPCSRHSSGRWCRRGARTLGRTAGADTAALRTGGNTPPTPVRRPAVVGEPEASGERTPRQQQSKQRRP